MTDAELARADVAAINLECAAGLPESRDLDKSSCLKRLESWTKTVRRWTAAALPEFFEPNRGQYRNSEAFFQTVALVTCLQRHCGLRFDPSKVGLGPEAPYAFDEMFVHGVLQGRPGTCATLPVVFASVGRKLGYPIRLARAKRHLYCRWDDPRNRETFNIEGSGDGFESFPDDHYRRWPEPLRDDAEERNFAYIRSLQPREEVAMFVGVRAFAHHDARRYQRAFETFEVARWHPTTGPIPFVWRLHFGTGNATSKPGVRPGFRPSKSDSEPTADSFPEFHWSSSKNTAPSSASKNLSRTSPQRGIGGNHSAKAASPWPNCPKASRRITRISPPERRLTMFHPNLGRWLQQDPIGFDAGDVNLYRGVENNPVNLLDPSGLEPITVEPGSFESGMGDPPDYRDMRPPAVIRNGVTYSNTRPQWDPVRFTRALIDRVVFRAQQSDSPAGTVTEDVEVRAWGVRRFPNDRVNDSGDHIAWVVVQVRFLRGKCTDGNGRTTDLPNRWLRRGFALNHGVFLRSARPPALDLFAQSMEVKPRESWAEFVDRFQKGAQAMGGR